MHRPASRMAGAGRTRSVAAMAAWSSLLLLLSAAAVDGGSADAGAPAPAADCTDALLSLAGCLSYVQEGSTVVRPDPTCCSGLKDVVKKEVACLCQAFQGSQNFGVTLNMTKALQLPAACKVKTPPFSKCHLSVPGVTGGAPAPAPFFGGLSPSTPSASPAATGSDDSAAVRAPAPSTSAAAVGSKGSAGLALLSAAVIAAAATLLAHRA
ncbi:non-specific lipid transfer protein GPI-anchored 11-like [Oryza brachyantha]|uniref:non-specific lipid transfer protein GPI-anchored 11-like n=1 Tax=Oryza brachyantha TaxID=4533 RepID=UPI001ADACC39|nr:non-specific lipid transfer protein GPI-anchored 11-like [Oryza brachyantha]